MAQIWCAECSDYVRTKKTRDTPALVMVIGVFIWLLVPFFSWFLAPPIFLIGALWYMVTPSVCKHCDGRDLKKIDVEKLKKQAKKKAARRDDDEPPMYDDMG